MENIDLDRTCGLTDDELFERFKAGIRLEDEKKRIKGIPLARYDAENDLPYLEYPDGRKVYEVDHE